MQVNLREALDDQVQQISFVWFRERIAEIDTVYHFVHILGKSVDMRVEILGDVIRMIQQALECIFRSVVERKA